MKKRAIAFASYFLVLTTGIILMVVFLFCNENILTKWKINNPYVNRKYSNWNNVTVYTDFSFAIPCEWTIQEDNGVYSVYDDTGRLWANGALFRTESAQFEDVCDFVSSVIHFSDISVEVDPYSSVRAMEGADVDKIYVHGAGFEREYYSLQLTKAMGEELLFILCCDIATSEEDFDIVEAIMYSFAWGE